jgi:hypothetical protein
MFLVALLPHEVMEIGSSSPHRASAKDLTNDHANRAQENEESVALERWEESQLEEVLEKGE